MTTIYNKTVNHSKNPSLASRAVELVETKELAWFFAVRDLKLRYRQTFFGLAWAILQPAVQALVALIILGRLIGVPTDGQPYLLFAYIGFICWTYIQRSYGSAAESLVTNPDLVSKIYFPRLQAPLGSMIPGFVDLAVGSVLLLPIMIYYQTAISFKLAALPVGIVLLLLTAAAPGIFLSAVNIKYRDVKHVVPFASQIWFYLTPIAYSSSIVPDSYLPLYRINPATSVVDLIRWALTDTPFPQFWWVSLIALVLFNLIALIVFSRMEKSFADVI